MPDATAAARSPLDRLMEDGCRFDFFQALWLLERMRPGKTPLGGRGPVAHENVRLRPGVSLAFPATDVLRTWTETDENDAARYHFDVAFMGLYGVSTPLPLHYAIDVLRSVDAADAARVESGARGGTRARESGHSPTRDFTDVFHHRILGLFYRAWTKYRFDAAYALNQRSELTDYVRWLIGIAPQIGEGDLEIDPVRMLRYAGVWTEHPRSAATLEGVLTDYFDGLPFRVKQFAGRWVTLATSDQNRIGLGASTLGMDLTVGARIFDLAGAFTIEIGPVSWDTYVTFLPDGPRHSQCRALVRMYCTDPLAIHFAVTLNAGQVPESRLTSDAGATRLGFTSWMRTGDVGPTTVTFDASFAGPHQRAVRRVPEPRGEKTGNRSATTASQGIAQGPSPARAANTG